MRLISTSFLLFAVSATTDAHTLATDESIPLQLGHQLLGLHHLPLTVLLLIGGIVLLRKLKKSGKFYG
jgi:hypothetical protein